MLLLSAPMDWGGRQKRRRVGKGEVKLFSSSCQCATMLSFRGLPGERDGHLQGTVTFPEHGWC